ncbi:MAG: hypothetical protein JWO49_434 [Arthrobacter sp.]|nr:hypothetical protein [Arthrobacter sp.]
MIRKLQAVLRFSRKQGLQGTTPFNFDGDLLDRKRNDVYVLMHQIGLIR